VLIVLPGFGAFGVAGAVFATIAFRSLTSVKLAGRIW
jgi:hypothetical protein